MLVGGCTHDISASQIKYRLYSLYTLKTATQQKCTLKHETWKLLTGENQEIHKTPYSQQNKMITY